MGTPEPRFDQSVYSIGHSVLPIEELTALLQQFRIEVLVDTRSFPMSNFAPQFNRDRVKEYLTCRGVKYLFMGRQLGGRPTGAQFYDEDGHVLYYRIAETEFFKQGIRRLERGIEKFRVAVLCSEEDPQFCHRSLLIGRVLRSRGIRMLHIRRNGRLETEGEIVARSAPQYRIFAGSMESEWKSVLSVSQRKQRNNSSKPFAESKSKDSSM
jgi:uncharacterized protein (DUF488 family)